MARSESEDGMQGCEVASSGGEDEKVRVAVSRETLGDRV